MRRSTPGVLNPLTSAHRLPPSQYAAPPAPYYITQIKRENCTSDVNENIETVNYEVDKDVANEHDICAIATRSLAQFRGHRFEKAALPSVRRACQRGTYLRLAAKDHAVQDAD